MKRARLICAAALLAVAAGGACSGVATSLGGRPGPEAGLIRGKQPLRSHGVTHVDRLTDGIAALPDDPALTDLSSQFASSEAFAIYDLGEVTPIACAAVVADGDDRYTLAASTDGTTFAPFWTAGAAEDRGMQPRMGRDLAGRGRWLRLTAAEGDGVYAVSEVAVAAACPPRWPPALALQHGTPLERSAQVKTWAFAAFAAAFILAYRRRSPDFIKLLVAIPMGLGLALFVQLADVWPPPPSVAGPLAAAFAIVAGATAIRVIVNRIRRRRREGRSA